MFPKQLLFFVVAVIFCEGGEVVMEQVDKKGFSNVFTCRAWIDDPVNLPKLKDNERYWCVSTPPPPRPLR